MIKIIIKIVTLILFICFLHSCKFEKKRNIEEILNLAINKVISDSLFISYRDECIEDFEGKFLIRESLLFSYQTFYWSNKKLFEKYLPHYLNDSLSYSDFLEYLDNKDSIRNKNFNIYDLDISLLKHNTLRYKNFLYFDYIESKILVINIENVKCSLSGIFYIFLLKPEGLFIEKKGNYNY